MISKSNFEEVQKRLPVQRAGNDDQDRRRVPAGAVQCAGCGSRLVVVRTARGQSYYRCFSAHKGDVRDAACGALVRVPD